MREIFGEPIPAQKPPGRRKRACDGCTAARQRCDLRKPCGNCAARQQSCSYADTTDQRRGSEVAPNITYPLPGSFENANFELLLGQDIEQGLSNFADFAITGNDQYTFTDFLIGQDLSQKRKPITTEFLLNFITCIGLDSSFNFTTADENHRNIVTFGQKETKCKQSEPFISSIDDYMESGSIQISQMMSWLSHPHFALSRALWDMIDTFKQDHSYLASSVEMEIMQSNDYVKLFAPRNMEYFLELYWSKWASNCPIIHEPSFDPLSVCPQLLLVMVITGALLCSNERTIQEARKWLDIAERIIFQHDLFSSRDSFVSNDDSEARLRVNLDILRSSLLVSVLQNWEGSQEAQWRIRHDRYQKVSLVSVLGYFVLLQS